MDAAKGLEVDLNWLRRLYTHMEWGDALVWRAVLAHEPSAEDPFIRESLLHLHVVQRAYLTGWKGGTPQPFPKDDFPSLPAIRDWGREVYPELTSFLDSLEASDLRVKNPVLWSEMIEKAIGQTPVPIVLGDMMHQVAAHSAHHRAQVNRRIRELDGEPPFIDFVAWAWMNDPSADWS